MITRNIWIIALLSLSLASGAALAWGMSALLGAIAPQLPGALTTVLVLMTTLFVMVWSVWLLPHLLRLAFAVTARRAAETVPARPVVEAQRQPARPRSATGAGRPPLAAR